MSETQKETKPTDSASIRNLEKAARCGEPSYVWREGQQRRLAMIQQAAGHRLAGRILENGCGVGMYIPYLAADNGSVIGLEYDLQRADEARAASNHLPKVHILCAAGEELPFQNETFDLILSHEVLEHVRDDRWSTREMTRVLRTGGRIVLFTPNRGYPFETHGIYWRGKYRFGNIPLVNYLPRRWRDRLAPHVRVYSQRDMEMLFQGLPVQLIQRSVVFGAYDNIIARWPKPGRALRAILQFLERTPLKVLGLSHFWVIEKLSPVKAAR